VQEDFRNFNSTLTDREVSPAETQIHPGREVSGEKRIDALRKHHVLDRRKQERNRNDQPRKCLDYRTPAEVFRAHLQEGG
jgi:hypothetical protein